MKRATPLVITLIVTAVMMGSGIGHVEAVGGDNVAAESVSRQIQLDTRLGGANVTVQTRGTKLMANGTVNSLTERELIEQKLRAAVGSAYTLHDIKVLAPVVSDDHLRQSIATAIPSHCLVKIDGFSIDVRKGVATLRGSASATHHRAMAEHIARNTRGVKQVINQITVSRTTLDDALTRDNLFFVFQEQGIPSSVTIKVRNGIATLQGAATADEAQRAGLIAETTVGVVAVKNTIVRRPYRDKSDSPGKY